VVFLEEEPVVPLAAVWACPAAIAEISTSPASAFKLVFIWPLFGWNSILQDDLAKKGDTRRNGLGISQPLAALAARKLPCSAGTACQL
jgi:hypothetical protein